MSNNNNNGGGGIGICGLLGVAFVVLKLTDVIDWSWWYVTLPFWAPISLVLAILGVVGVFFAVKEIRK